MNRPALARIGEGVRRSPVVTAIGVVALVAVGWTVVRMATLDWLPMGDYRTLQLRVADVGGSHTPLVGLYSRFGWNHPGPWVLWLLAGPYRLLGVDGLLVGALVIDAASIAAAIAVCARAGRRWMFVVGLAVAALCCGIGLGGLADPWNPYLVVLPLFAMLVGTWRSIEGSRSGAIVAVVAGSFAVASHFGAAPLVTAMLVVVAISLGWRSWRGPDPRADRRTLGWCAFVGVVMWLPALVEQATHSPGNLRALLTFAVDGSGEGSNGLDSGARIVARSLTSTFDWVTGRSASLAGGLLDTHAFALPVGLLALAAVMVLAVRRRDLREISLCAVAALAVVAQVVAMSRISGPLFPYLVRTTWAVAAFVWMAVVGVVVSWLAERRAARSAAGDELVTNIVGGLVILVIVLTMVRGIDTMPLGPYDNWARARAAIVPAVVDAVRSAPGPVLLVNGDLSDGAIGSEVLAAARAAGLPVAKPSSLAWIVGEHRTMDPATAATSIVIMANERIEPFAADPSCRLLVRYDSLSPAERAELAELELAPSRGLDIAGLSAAQIDAARRLALDEWRVRESAASSPSVAFQRFRQLANSGDVIAAFECPGPR